MMQWWLSHVMQSYVIHDSFTWLKPALHRDTCCPATIKLYPLVAVNMFLVSATKLLPVCCPSVTGYKGKSTVTKMNSNYVAEIQSTCIPNEQLVAGQHVSWCKRGLNTHHAIFFYCRTVGVYMVLIINTYMRERVSVHCLLQYDVVSVYN